jgi:glycosyltransferase involved in cell wall biosynthesis
MRNATRLVAFSRSARREAISNAGIPPHKVSMIYLGLPASERDVSSNRERLALTVGGVWEENLLRKGLLPFVEAAAHLPHVQFLLVGRWYDDSIDVLRQAAGPNVKFSGFVPDDRLSAIYGRSSVYVQASLHEGFGMSVAEAMLAGCVPVVTDRGSLPEIVGDIGVYASSNEPRAVAEGIRHALSMNGGARHKAQERVLTHFPLERRRKALYDLIDQIVRETE